MSEAQHKVIWLDVDGVLLDYTRAFIDYADLNLKGVTYDNLRDYDLTKLFSSKQECLTTMLNFALSYKFRFLPPIAGPLALQALKNVGYELRIITKLPAPTRAKIHRVVNLTQHFGPIFSEIVFTDTECKLEYLLKRKSAEFYSHYTVVEDNPDFLIKAQEILAHGVRAFDVFGIKHPYNHIVHDALPAIPMYDIFDDVALSLLERKLDA